MPINVICTGCKKRFAVNEKFAGQKGPCPSCKTIITIPKLEDQVVVHAPEGSGPADTKGRPVLTPIKRTDSKFSAKITIAAVVSVSVVIALAVMLGRTFDGQVPILLQGLAALLLGKDPHFASGIRFNHTCLALTNLRRD